MSAPFDDLLANVSWSDPRRSWYRNNRSTRREAFQDRHTPVLDTQHKWDNTICKRCQDPGVCCPCWIQLPSLSLWFSDSFLLQFATLHLRFKCIVKARLFAYSGTLGTACKNSIPVSRNNNNQKKASLYNGMSCPRWQYHITGYRWFPVRTLPVAPLWCDLARCSRTVVVIKLRRTCQTTRL